MSKIKQCTCSHDYQDRLYGKGYRVHNCTKQNLKYTEQGLRCTVCGKETY